jgi:hypothetical protein
MNLGLLGLPSYGEIFIDQRSKRSHPNKAVDVVVCPTSRIDSGSRFINSGPASETNRLDGIGDRYVAQLGWWEAAEVIDAVDLYSTQF